MNAPEARSSGVVVLSGGTRAFQGSVRRCRSLWRPAALRYQRQVQRSFTTKLSATGTMDQSVRSPTGRVQPWFQTT